MAAPAASGSNSVPRLVVAVLSQGGSSWFFNLSGESRCVEEQKPAFLEFLRSVEVEAAPPSAPGPEPVGPATASGSEAGGKSRKPSWDVPPGWKELPATSMVLARFGADSNDGKVEVSVSAFPGDVGGLVANVNRWRGQIGLARVEDAEAQKLATPLDVPPGRAMLVDMSGQKDGKAVRLIGAMMPHGAQTWFFKLLGDEAAAAREKAAFLKFLQTVRFPDA
jgi:hypothetical protein